MQNSERYRILVTVISRLPWSHCTLGKRKQPTVFCTDQRFMLGNSSISSLDFLNPRHRRDQPRAKPLWISDSEWYTTSCLLHFRLNILNDALPYHYFLLVQELSTRPSSRTNYCPLLRAFTLIGTLSPHNSCFKSRKMVVLSNVCSSQSIHSYLLYRTLN